jgi:heme exporter protein C
VSAYGLTTLFQARAKGGLAVLAAMLLVAALLAAFVIAPEEAEMGDVQRIFYFHVASAWAAFVAFFLVFLGSVAYLRTRALGWDVLAVSAAEIGVVFTSVTLASGSVWARSAWGTWWTWEPRLTTTLMLWLIYVSYLVLRGMVEESDRRAAFAAVFGIIGFVDVPIVFMSIRWWRTLHPQVVGTEGFNMEAAMLPALFLSVAAFTVVLTYLLLLRTGLERSQQEMVELRRRVRWLQEDGGG